MRSPNGFGRRMHLDGTRHDAKASPLAAREGARLAGSATGPTRPGVLTPALLAGLWRLTPATTALRLGRGRWIAYRHLEVLSSWLADIAAGRRRRIMVMMPPRHGKSSLCSHWLPVWFLEQFASRRVILASYEADFAASWGRMVRNTLLEHRSIMRTQLRQDSMAANRWETTLGGGMVTAGVGGPITGRGADLLILDDPVKNAEEAYSPIVRERMWEWWQTTAYTRLEPGGAVLLVNTRWHQDDLAGRILQEAERGGEAWDVLQLPALAEPGDPLQRPEGAPLCPERYDLPALERIRQTIGAYAWAALYQQRPAPREGGFLKRQWFRLQDAMPTGVPWVRYWDLAATEARRGADPDWTAGARVCCHQGVWYIADMRRLQATPRAVEDLIRQTAQMDGPGVPIYIEQEPGSSGKNTIDHYQRDVLVGYASYGQRSSGSKEERARPLSAAAEAGNVVLQRAAWNGPFLDEAELFPAGAHDDQIDAVSGAMAVAARGGGLGLQGLVPLDFGSRESPWRV